MARLKIYTLVELVINDWEEEINVETYHYKENAVNALKSKINGEYAQIIKEREYAIDCQTDTKFWCGYEGDYSRGSIQTKIYENEVLDYSV